MVDQTDSSQTFRQPTYIHANKNKHHHTQVCYLNDPWDLWVFFISFLVIIQLDMAFTGSEWMNGKNDTSHCPFLGLWTTVLRHLRNLASEWPHS